MPSRMLCASSRQNLRLSLCSPRNEYWQYFGFMRWTMKGKQVYKAFWLLSLMAKAFFSSTSCFCHSFLFPSFSFSWGRKTAKYAISPRRFYSQQTNESNKQYCQNFCQLNNEQMFSTMHKRWSSVRLRIRYSKKNNFIGAAASDAYVSERRMKKRRVNGRDGKKENPKYKNNHKTKGNFVSWNNNTTN